MTIHKEGYKIVAITIIICLIINVLSFYFCNINCINYTVLTFLALFFLLILQFFRHPKRKLPDNDENTIICPADGKVVVIEEVEEGEYFKEKRLQVSIFMSPLNVHVNRYPIDGIVKYSKYHQGKYLVAWHPKSSTENERTSIVIEDDKGRNVLVRQIAGALARRIVCYSKEGDRAVKGDDLGFIKFGSRVDLFLPLDTKIHVKLDDKVKGNISVIGRF